MQLEKVKRSFTKQTIQDDDDLQEDMDLVGSEDEERLDLTMLQSEKLTEEQKALLNEIAEQFDPEKNDTDLSILYEVTGFQGQK